MVACEAEGAGFSLNLGDLHAYPEKHSRIERILQIKLRSQLDPLEHNTQAPNTRINLFSEQRKHTTFFQPKPPVQTGRRQFPAGVWPYDTILLRFKAGLPIKLIKCWKLKSRFWMLIL